MPDLMTALHESDDGLFFAFSQVWGVPITNLKPEQAVKALHGAMLEPARAEKVWDTLTDDQRGALQALISSNKKMQRGLFVPMRGEIRKMGRGQIEKQLPHRNPQTIAEALFYRGLVFEMNEQTRTGIQQFFYIPDDLAQILPTHKNSYAHLKDIPDSPQMTYERPREMRLVPLDDDMLEEIHTADTSVVDDLCTLLSYLRNFSAGVEENTLLPVDVERLTPYLLVDDPHRLSFLLEVGVSADLITTQEGRAYPKRDGLQKWLSLTRSEQLNFLLEGWYKSTIYHDLWHVPDLFPDIDAGFPYDPRVGRESLVTLLHNIVPTHEWWSIDEFVEAIKEIEPHYQRPNGDYDSWYIRNRDGEYLRGFDSWDAVDGALLEFYIKGPMHWLGLTDISEDAARLTAYGRGFAGVSDWPHPADTPDMIEIREDGILIASRKVSRVDRFQVARFTTWGEGGTPYQYRLDANGIQQAVAQGITTNHIATFLKRQNGEKPLPPRIANLLEKWQGGMAKTEVTFEKLLVLRTTSIEIMDRIFKEPALRRYLGARLGEMACIIRAGQEEELQVALGESGIAVQILG